MPGGKKPTYLNEHDHTVINPALHDEDFEESVRIANSGLPETALREIGTDHRLADPEPLEAMLVACEQLTEKT